MKSKSLFLLVLLAIASTTFAQQTTPWNQWNWLMGSWAGEGGGQPGQGGGTFSFAFDLDKNILVRKSHSEYPATANKPAVVHDDLMIIYPDFTGNVSRAIYFDNEGHTINYGITYADSAIVFTSDKIPNVPTFRLTYSQLAQGVVNTKFELSPDGVKFTTYVEGKSKKVD